MFYGRQQQLKLLTNLTQPSAPSYALVGPRSIGKTSLINRAYEELRQRGEAVIRLEFSATRYEPQLIDQMLAAVSEDLRVRQSSQRSTAVGLLESHVRLAAKNAPSKRVVILLDEADEMQHRCPALADSLRLLHDQGHVRVVLVGYKQLRKDVHNAHKPGLFNVLQPLSLSRLNLHECDELVVYPMTDLQVQITDTAGVVESLFVSSGGGPNRVQLLCHALVNSLENKTARTITAQDAENAIDLPEVRKVVADWYNQSTSKLEKYIAAIAAQVTPCDGEAIIAAVQADAPEIDAETIRTQTQDLITADILDYQRDGKLAFTFPAAKETAFPTAGGSHWLADLRKGVLAKK
jgi:GTPase SAR1 family protein